MDGYFPDAKLLSSCDSNFDIEEEPPMIFLTVPSSSDALEDFLGKAYASPMVGIFASNGEDWCKSRDEIVHAAMGMTAEERFPIKWFLAVPMPQPKTISRHAFLVPDSEDSEEDSNSPLAGYDFLQSFQQERPEYVGMIPWQGESARRYTRRCR
jgi:hypothetical protein